MVSVSIKTAGFQALLSEVSRLSRVELKKVVADSGGRVGVDLAKRTFPKTEEQGRGKIKRQLSGIFPPAVPLKKQITAKSEQASIAFSRLLEQRRFSEAEAVARGVGLPWTLQPKPTKETHRSRIRPSGSGLAVIKSPDAIWLTSAGSFDSYSKRVGNRVGTAANGWVMASRAIRRARTSDNLPAFKRRKRPMVTGSGRMGGSPNNPKAILHNEVDYASFVTPSESVQFALKREKGNLELQIKNLLKNVGRRSRR